MTLRRVAALTALLFGAGCPSAGDPQTPPRREATTGAGGATASLSAAPADAAAACDGRSGAPLEEPLELPDDLRIAARIDLESPELEAALGHLERWAATPSADAGEDDDGPAGEAGEAKLATDGATAGEGALSPPPLVAGLALSQIGFQVGHIRDLLGGLGFAPPELLLLQDPEGAVVWMWRLPCDLESLRALVERGWELRLRTLVSGAIAEPREAARFPFDLLLLPGDRLALVPAGQGLRLLRWLTGGAPRPSIGAEKSGESPSEAITSLEAAAVRLVVELRVGGVFSLGAQAGERLLLRAGADGLSFVGGSGSLPSAP